MIGATSVNQIRALKALPGVVLLDFYKQDCGPCKLMEATVRTIDATMDRVTVVKIDVDAFPGVAAQHGVTAFPTFVILKGGSFQSVVVGRVPGAKLRDELNKALTK